MMQSSRSAYFDNLEADDQQQYTKKLTLNNGRILEDPFSITEGWIADITRLPDISWPDIYTYLIETPSEFTKDKLKAYKSLSAYNFFLSGHVQDVYFYDAKQNFCYVKTSVLPSQRQGLNQNLYNVWVVMHMTGWILCGNCTCMAG